MSSLRPLIHILTLAALLAATGCMQTTKTEVTLSTDPDRGVLTVESPLGARNPLPLLVVLHGYGANPFIQSLYFSFGSYVSEKKFHLVYLTGTKDSKGKRFWNASPSCCNLDGSKVDDVQYVSEAIDAIRGKLPVSKVFIAGHSNGGFMALRLACDLGNKIDGIFSLAGADVQRICAPRMYKEFRTVLAHGMKDDVISTKGGSYQGLPRYQGFGMTREIWKSRLGCMPSLIDGEKKDYSLGIWGEDSALIREDCGDKNRLVTIRIEEGSHRPWINSSFREDVLTQLLE